MRIAISPKGLSSFYYFPFPPPAGSHSAIHLPSTHMPTPPRALNGSGSLHGTFVVLRTIAPPGTRTGADGLGVTVGVTVGFAVGVVPFGVAAPLRATAETAEPESITRGCWRRSVVGTPLLPGSGVTIT
jgi:hypothetical protein